MPRSEIALSCDGGPRRSWLRKSRADRPCCQQVRHADIRSDCARAPARDFSFSYLQPSCILNRLIANSKTLARLRPHCHEHAGRSRLHAPVRKTDAPVFSLTCLEIAILWHQPSSQERRPDLNSATLGIVMRCVKRAEQPVNYIAPVERGAYPMESSTRQCQPNEKSPSTCWPKGFPWKKVGATGHR
jgi:hypothetical protein